MDQKIHPNGHPTKQRLRPYRPCARGGARLQIVCTLHIERTGTQWVSETSFKMLDQGSFSCVGTDCAAVSDPDCNVNGVRTYSL
jgi:hypothetical protein